MSADMSTAYSRRARGVFGIIVVMTAMTEEDTTRPFTRRSRGRALGFVAGAAFMCVLSAGVGAGAATLVTSAQIKDGTIIGRDVKNGGLTGRDVKARSLTGKHVKDGTIDTTDLSTGVSAALVDATIPSGTTVTGIEYFDTTASVSGDYRITVTLPGRAHAPLTNQMVWFGGTDTRVLDKSAACTGTTDAPTAPAGFVCVYLAAAATDSKSIAGMDIGGTITDQAFSVFWNDDATESADVLIKFSWAYTAP